MRLLVLSATCSHNGPGHVVPAAPGVKDGSRLYTWLTRLDADGQAANDLLTHVQLLVKRASLGFKCGLKITPAEPNESKAARDACAALPDLQIAQVVAALGKSLTNQVAMAGKGMSPSANRSGAAGATHHTPGRSLLLRLFFIWMVIWSI